MRVQDLDDHAPIEPDDSVRAKVYARTRTLLLRRRIARFAISGSALVLVMGIVAIAVRSSRDDQVAITASLGAGPVRLAGTWTPRLIAGYDGPIANYRWHTAPTIRFDGLGRWAGSDGCNDLGGPYHLHGNEFDARFDSGTLIDCAPPKIPTTSLLRSTQRVEREGRTLTFLRANGRVLATYDLVPNQSQARNWEADANSERDNGGVAYVSHPIDVIRSGRYTLVFGPVTPADAAQFATANGIGLYTVSDATFDSTHSHTPVLYTDRDGTRYLRLTWIVTAVRAEYDDYRVLLQYPGEAIPTCRASQLRASGSWQGAGGMMGGTISFDNISDQACALAGPPDIRLVRADGIPLNLRTPISQGKPPPHVILQPHTTHGAIVAIVWQNWCGDNAAVSVTVAIPPAAATLTVNDKGFSSRPRCDNPNAPSELAIGPFQTPSE